MLPHAQFFHCPLLSLQAGHTDVPTHTTNMVSLNVDKLLFTNRTNLLKLWLRNIVKTPRKQTE
jgi:hypothetical protein